jgi:hypothetical protein
MLYKTIALQILEDHAEIHDQLRRRRILFSTMERLATELKASHEAWQERLSQAKPGSDASQIASEALELALEQLVSHLPSEFPANENEPLSLDEAMAYVKHHTPTA